MKHFLTLTLAAAMVMTSGVTEPALAQHHKRPPSGGGFRGCPPPPPPPCPTVFHKSSHRSHRGWSNAGYVLAGVVAGSLLQSTAFSGPSHREVHTYHTVYQQPTVVHQVHYAQPEVIYKEVPVRETVYVTQPEVIYKEVPVYVSQPVAIRAAPVKETVWVTNSNGSQTPVELRRSGSQYIGPKGEYYGALPTNEQLRLLYGM